MKKDTQLSRLLEFVKIHRSITSLEAVQYLGCTRLAARIFELERKGYIFNRCWEKVKNRYGEAVRVVRYTYIGKLEDVA